MPRLRSLVALAILALPMVGAPVLSREAAAEAPRACPASGRVEHTGGSPTIYLGIVPDIPDLCWMQRGDTPEGAYYLGIWAAEWPGAGLAYPAMHRVMHGPVGTTEEFITRSAPGWQWHGILRNEGIETVTLPDGRRVRALRMSHERIGIEDNIYHSVITVWKEMTSGMIVRQEHRHIAGQPVEGAAWEPTSVTGLPPRAAGRADRRRPAR
ncbi:hypothetical protein [Muricoccus radiodurans]|uniref:hypothetical protein n=1 Tax=Muricoccus radiodurans TaxID=2231721 RepID=UPI003CF3E0AC